jgi:leucyl-tRNA synthetase
MSFNTAISQMMICLNDMEKLEAIKQSDFELFMKILSPFTPHVTEEIWSALGNKGLLAMESWPVADVSKMAESQVTIMIQINGKLRSQMTVAVTDTEETIVSQAQKLGEIQKWLEGKTIKKAIYVPKRLVNFVL